MKGAHAGWVVPGGCNKQMKNIIKSHQLCLSFLLGNFVSTKYNLSGAYMPSFQKREVGSVGQRIQLTPLAGQHTSKMFFHLCEADKIITDTFRSDNVPTYLSQTVALTIRS